MVDSSCFLVSARPSFSPPLWAVLDSNWSQVKADVFLRSEVPDRFTFSPRELRGRGHPLPPADSIRVQIWGSQPLWATALYVAVA